jgi:hypothetical protein
MSGSGVLEEPLVRRRRRVEPDPSALADPLAGLIVVSAERLKWAIKTRKERGVRLKFYELATNAGASDRTLRYGTRGKGKPDGDQVMRLAHDLRVHPFSLYVPSP